MNREPIMKSSLSMMRGAALLLASLSTAQAAPASGLAPRISTAVGGDVTLRIMPLGDSITFGVGSSDENGYRAYLQRALNDDGNPVFYVGSRNSGEMENNNNEGWEDYPVDAVFDKARESVPGTLPNLVLITAGTDNCVRDDADPANAGEQMGEMVEWILDNSVRASVVVSTLLVNENPDVEQCLQDINRQYSDLVDDLQGRSLKAVLADMRSEEGPTAEDLVDETHPGDEGYRKMARVWFSAIEDAASRGWLEEPQDAEEAEQPEEEQQQQPPQEEQEPQQQPPQEEQSEQQQPASQPRSNAA